MKIENEIIYHKNTSSLCRHNWRPYYHSDLGRRKQRRRDQRTKKDPDGSPRED